MNDNMDFMYKIFRLGNLMHKDHHRRNRGICIEGFPGQGRVLSLLKANPNISQKDLAALLEIRPQSLGESLMRLERNGFLTRTPNKMDHRVMNIELTSAGIEAANRCKANVQASVERFNCLSDKEKEQFNDFLDRVINEFEKTDQ